MSVYARFLLSSLFQVFTPMIYTSRSSVVLSLPFFAAPPAFCVSTGGGRLSFFLSRLVVWFNGLVGWLLLPVACRASFAVWGLGALTSVAPLFGSKRTCDVVACKARPSVSRNLFAVTLRRHFARAACCLCLVRAVYVVVRCGSLDQQGPGCSF